MRSYKFIVVLHFDLWEVVIMSIHQVKSVKSHSQIAALNRLVKSVCDRVFAAIALVVFSSFLLLVAIAIYIRDATSTQTG